MRHELFPAAELEPGTMRAADVDGVEVVVIRKLDGSYAAFRNVCSHLGARLSNGRLHRKVVGDVQGERRLDDDLVLHCPWHGFEFDVDTGRCVAEPQRVRGRKYAVEVVDGVVMLTR